MRNQVWRWVLGLIYIVAVATIWIAASFVVQSVVDSGVSPFLITYICNSLFVVLIPIVEIARYLEDSVPNFWFWHSNRNDSQLQSSGESEEVVLLGDSDLSTKPDGLHPSELVQPGGMSQEGKGIVPKPDYQYYEPERILPGEASMSDFSGIANVSEDVNKQLDAKGHWTRTRVAKVSLLICPFWFLAQLTFNLSLKYTTVTVRVF